ncbi:MAG TPA: PAS domain S-box protein, partial [Chloroflexota bacterium]|nr:PAS domain S-box protein [Chloroflexota bacterium]
MAQRSRRATGKLPPDPEPRGTSISSMPGSTQPDQARSYLAAIVESSEDAIIGLTMGGLITSWNPAAERLYGYCAEEAMGRPISILVPSGRANELEPLLERLGRGEGIQHYETVRVRKDGSLVDVSVSVSAIRDSEGKVLGIATIARDVSERRRMEEGLRASEANYRAIFDAASDAIFVIDPQTHLVVDVNRRLREMYGGYTPDEARNLAIGTFSLGEPPYDQENAARLVEKAAAGEPQLFEWLARGKTGRLFWVEVSLKRATIGGKTRVLAVV